MEVTPSASGEPSLSALISQESGTAAISCPMPPPMPTTTVAVTTSPVSTPFPSSVTPTSLFDSPFSVFFCNWKGDAYGVRCSRGNQCRGYRHGRCWRDKRYQPRWKIAESSRLIFPPTDSTLG
ncbi:hypothetical protein Hanom_Chr04g00349811 [Helianthus anomalus]